MAKYYVNVPVYAAMGMEVEADSEEEALVKAECELSPGLCWQCAQDVELGDDLDWDKATVEEIV